MGQRMVRERGVLHETGSKVGAIGDTQLVLVLGDQCGRPSATSLWLTVSPPGQAGM